MTRLRINVVCWKLCTLLPAKHNTHTHRHTRTHTRTHARTQTNKQTKEKKKEKEWCAGCNVEGCGGNYSMFNAETRGISCITYGSCARPVRSSCPDPSPVKMYRYPSSPNRSWAHQSPISIGHKVQTTGVDNIQTIISQGTHSDRRAGIAQWFREPDSWSKGRGFESLLERRENFLLQGDFLCWLLFRIRSTPVLPQ